MPSKEYRDAIVILFFAPLALAAPVEVPEVRIVKDHFFFISRSKISET